MMGSKGKWTDKYRMCGMTEHSDEWKLFSLLIANGCRMSVDDYKYAFGISDEKEARERAETSLKCIFNASIVPRKKRIGNECKFRLVSEVGIYGEGIIIETSEAFDDMMYQYTNF